MSITPITPFNSDNPVYFNMLPDAANLAILHKLPPAVLAQMSLTCKHFNRLFQDQSSWANFCLPYGFEKNEDETWLALAKKSLHLVPYFFDGTITMRKPRTSVVEKGEGGRIAERFVEIDGQNDEKERQLRVVQSLSNGVIQFQKKTDRSVIFEEPNDAWSLFRDLKTWENGLIYVRKDQIKIYDYSKASWIYIAEDLCASDEMFDPIYDYLFSNNNLIMCNTTKDKSKTRVTIQNLKNPKRSYSFDLSAYIKLGPLKGNILIITGHTSQRRKVHLIDIKNKRMRENVFSTTDFVEKIYWDGCKLYLLMPGERSISRLAIQNIAELDFSKEVSELFEDQPSSFPFKEKEPFIKRRQEGAHHNL